VCSKTVYPAPPPPAPAPPPPAEANAVMKQAKMTNAKANSAASGKKKATSTAPNTGRSSIKTKPVNKMGLSLGGSNASGLSIPK
jgi:hypothetical protein